MSGSRELAKHFADTLAPLGAIDLRRFFGGWGLHHQGQLFAVVMDTLYFRVDRALRAELARRGGGPFAYRARGKRVVVEKLYCVPDASVDDPETLVELAKRALVPR